MKPVVLSDEKYITEVKISDNEMLTGIQTVAFVKSHMTQF